MTELTLLTAFLLAVVATARLTRLLIHDVYPPAVALRLWWWNQTVAKGGWRTGWHRLLVGEDPDDSGCPFCAAPYLSAIVLAVGMAAGIWQPGWSLAGVWWTGAVWATLSYLAAIFVVRDEPLDA